VDNRYRKHTAARNGVFNTFTTVQKSFLFLRNSTVLQRQKKKAQYKIWQGTSLL